MSEIEVKLDILESSINKKIEILNQIYNITENQELFVKNLSGEEREEYLKSASEEKQKLIDEILKIDTVFISTFESFNGMLNENRKLYRERILMLQEKIKAVMDIDVKIRVKEERNRQLFIPNNTINAPVVKGLKANKSYILEQYAKNTTKTPKQ